jgi:hypothetical protein
VPVLPPLPTTLPPFSEPPVLPPLPTTLPPFSEPPVPEPPGPASGETTFPDDELQPISKMADPRIVTSDGFLFDVLRAEALSARICLSFVSIGRGNPGRPVQRRFAVE